MDDKPKTELLTVDFYEADVGWLFYKLTVGKQSFEDRFSHVYDPLPDLKCWLEAISIGVQQTSFKYNNEGCYIKYDFERVYWDREVLTIAEAYEDGEVFIKANIDRQQLVKAFYLGLLNFANSDKYIPLDWEVSTIKELLCIVLSLDEDALLEFLINFNRNQLGEVLSRADSIFFMSNSEPAEKIKAWNSFLQYTIDMVTRNPNAFKNAKTPIYWNIPEDYDVWSTDKKRELVIECIKETINSYDGMKLTDFRSSIIEEYLASPSS